MSSTQETTLAEALADYQSLVPPYSPVVWEPAVKHSYPFDTNFSRDPARIRIVFNAYVEKTKEMNSERQETYSGKRRAQNLGLKVDIQQAKGLHWRSIQARPPVILTTSLNSPPRTPRIPATEYPSAESLYLKNVADAQKKQNYLESCRWSVFAERENAISKWEAEQTEALCASQALGSRSSGRSDRLPSVSSQREETQGIESSHLSWDDSCTPMAASSSHMRSDNSMSSLFGSTSSYCTDDRSQIQTIVEMPPSLIDGSQSLRPDSLSDSFILSGDNQMQTFSALHVGDPSFQGARLSRSSSMHHHIPATSLRMAPTPLRPRIDHHSMSYPSSQVTRLSYGQPSDTPALAPMQTISNVSSYYSKPSPSGMSSSQPTARLTFDPVTPNQSIIGVDDTSTLKKRRSDAEHFAVPKRKLW